jgi:hypothetical protein
VTDNLRSVKERLARIEHRQDDLKELTRGLYPSVCALASTILLIQALMANAAGYGYTAFVALTAGTAFLVLAVYAICKTPRAWA